MNLLSQRLVGFSLLTAMFCSTSVAVRADEMVGFRATRRAARSHRVVWQSSGTPAEAPSPGCVEPAVTPPVVLPAPAVVADADPRTAKPGTPEPSSAPTPDSETAQQIAEDWKRLEGVWERIEFLPNGGQLRTEKTIKGHQESLKMFGPDGTLLREQTAEIELSRAGQFRVLKWSQAVVVAGPDTGSKINDGTAVYVFKAGKWVSTIGLADDEKWGVYTEAWTPVFDAAKGQ